MKIKPKGSISVFLSSIFLIMIVFTCTMIDVTRIHIAQGQAERALLSAGHSVLAAYDSQLQSQYGIFARSYSDAEFKELIRHYLQPTLNPHTIDEDTNPLLDFSSSNQPSFNLLQYQIQSIDIINEIPISQPSYIKLQILEFMKYRAPLIHLEPFLEKLGIMSKASKTTEIIEQKNNIVAEVQALQDSFIQLEMLVDGIMVDDSSGLLVTDHSGLPILTSNYVKKLYVDDGGSACYSVDEIPLESLKKVLCDHIWKVDETLLKYQEALKSCEKAIADAFNAFSKLKELEKRLERLEEKLSQIDASSDLYALELFEIELKISDTKESIHKQKAQIDDLVLSFISYDQWIYNEAIPKLRLLYVSDHSKELAGYIKIHEDALKEIENIKAQTPAVVDRIQKIKPILENKEGLYIQNTCTNIKSEIKEYEKLLGINEDQTLTLVNDILAMEVALKENIRVLQNTETEIVALAGIKASLYSFWWNESKGSLGESELKELLSYFPEEFSETSFSSSKTTSRQAVQYLDTLENKLDQYNRQLYFNYGDINTEKPSNFKLSDITDLVKGAFPEVNLPELPKSIENVSLPSTSKNIVQNEESHVIEEVDVACSNHFLENLKKMGNFFAEGFVDIRNTLYINEYAIGMFRCATDHLIDQSDPSKKPLTLNHYPKEKHFLNYEVEYILFGQHNDTTNLMATIGAIFAIRIGLNTISLLSDMDKMKLITNLANSLAGWWSLGIGSIIVVVVLTLVWSIIESVSDIQKLLNDERVPIIKDSNTWETDLGSGIMHIAKEVTEEVAEDVVDEVTEGGYLPTLSYADYLRLLLIGGVVDEDTKLLRILDLIQLNMGNERNEEIDLVNYISAFETEVTFDVDYLFFKLPFMPKKTQEAGHSFGFSKKIQVSY